LTANMVRKNQK